jgi:hypothetical protein
MTFLISGTTTLYKLHLVLQKDKLNSKHLKLNFERVIILDKDYDRLVLFM